MGGGRARFKTTWTKKTKLLDFMYQYRYIFVIFILWIYVYDVSSKVIGTREQQQQH